jgi:hypothetical protein
MVKVDGAEAKITVRINMKANIKTIKRMVLVNSLGHLAIHTKECIKMMKEKGSE